MVVFIITLLVGSFLSFHAFVENNKEFFVTGLLLVGFSMWGIFS